MGNAISAFFEFEKGQFVADNSVFTAPETYSLACFVTSDLVLEERIQSEFRKRYGGIEWLKQQDTSVGNSIAMQSGDIFIYYNVIKEKTYFKGTIADLRASIDAMIIHAEANGVVDIALPDFVYSEFCSDKLILELDDAFNGKAVNYHIYKT